MIRVRFFRNEKGAIRGFEAKNHGKSVVCAAVSMLTFNTVNAIEAFTDVRFTCDKAEDGGFLRFRLTETQDGDSRGDHDALLLLRALALGLESLKAEYPKEIDIQ